MSSDKSKGKIVFSGNDIHYPGQTNHDYDQVIYLIPMGF